MSDTCDAYGCDRLTSIHIQGFCCSGCRLRWKIRTMGANPEIVLGERFRDHTTWCDENLRRPLTTE